MSMLSFAPATSTLVCTGFTARPGSFCLLCEKYRSSLPTVTSWSVSATCADAIPHESVARLTAIAMPQISRRDMPPPSARPSTPRRRLCPLTPTVRLDQTPWQAEQTFPKERGGRCERVQRASRHMGQMSGPSGTVSVIVTSNPYRSYRSRLRGLDASRYAGWCRSSASRRVCSSSVPPSPQSRPRPSSYLRAHSRPMRSSRTWLPACEGARLGRGSTTTSPDRSRTHRRVCGSWVRHRPWKQFGSRTSPPECGTNRRDVTAMRVARPRWSLRVR